jgi:nitroimidazol reductase NimA-like FMN-containing flavoprotein (pyridoxamine 5'-phosphate oxidase superfamily)
VNDDAQPRGDDFTARIDELDDEHCIELLEACMSGRVGFNDDADGVTVLPVNFLYSRGAVVFRTSDGSALDRIRDGRQVAFEADEMDRQSETGWSVLVRGQASLITDQQWLASLADTEVRPWAPGHRDLWIQIQPDRMTGRVIRKYRGPSTLPG